MKCLNHILITNKQYTLLDYWYRTSIHLTHRHSTINMGVQLVTPSVL